MGKKLKFCLKKEFNSEPIYNDEYVKTKIKTYNDRVYANFRYNKIPKIMNISHVYL